MQMNGYMSKTFAEVYIKTFTLITLKWNRLLPYRYIYIINFSQQKKIILNYTYNIKCIKKYKPWEFSCM